VEKRKDPEIVGIYMYDQLFMVQHNFEAHLTYDLKIIHKKIPQQPSTDTDQ